MLRCVFYLSLVAVLATQFVSCKPKELSSTAMKTANSEVLNTDSLVFSYERTACFGQCPMYKIEVYKSGYTVYEGKNFTEKIGFYAGTTDKNWLNSINKEAIAIGFYTLPDRIETQIADFPSKIIYFNLNGKKKIVDDPSAGPEKLRALQQKIEEYYQGLELRPLESKK